MGQNEDQQMRSAVAANIGDDKAKFGIRDFHVCFIGVGDFVVGILCLELILVCKAVRPVMGFLAS